MTTKEYIEYELKKVQDSSNKRLSAYSRKKNHIREEKLLNALRYLELFNDFKEIESEVGDDN